MKRLYFIAATDGDGINVDLFVAALSVPDAIEAWREYYERAEHYPEGSDPDPDRVFEVPSIGDLILDTWSPSKALGWHKDVKQVGGECDKPADGWVNT